MKQIARRVAFWLWYLTPVLRGWKLQRMFCGYKRAMIEQRQFRCRRLREAHWEREGRLDKACAAKVAAVRDKHAKELAEAKSHIVAVIERCSHIRFDCEQDRYSILLEFSPLLVAFGPTHHEELRFIVQELARQVEHEIATAKFIQPANERESLDRVRKFLQRTLIPKKRDGDTDKPSAAGANRIPPGTGSGRHP